MPDQQIPDQIFSAHKKLIRQHIPGAYEETFLVHKLRDQFAAVGFYFKIISNDYTLTVKMESSVIRMLFKNVEDVINHFNKHLPVSLEGETPFAVPVCI